MTVRVTEPGDDARRVASEARAGIRRQLEECVKLNGSGAQCSRSLYSAAANSAVGWTARTLLMMVAAFARTFAIAGPIEPVVSDKKTMSGFGGIGGVWTVFVIVRLEPDSTAARNDGGLTPVPAEAGAASMRDISTPDAAPSPRIRVLIRSSPFREDSSSRPILRTRRQVKPSLSAGPAACPQLAWPSLIRCAYLAFRYVNRKKNWAPSVLPAPPGTASTASRLQHRRWCPGLGARLFE